MLSDISQADMSEAGHDRGLGKHELSQAERGKITIRHFHLPMLCEILGVPMSWFTEPRHVIVAQRAADYQAVLAELLELATGTGGGQGRGAAGRSGRDVDDGPTGPLPGAADDDVAPAQQRRARGQSRSRR
jgi:hypothetical protein